MPRAYGVPFRRACLFPPNNKCALAPCSRPMGNSPQKCITFCVETTNFFCAWPSFRRPKKNGKISRNFWRFQMAFAARPATFRLPIHPLQNSLSLWITKSQCRSLWIGRRDPCAFRRCYRKSACLIHRPNPLPLTLLHQSTWELRSRSKHTLLWKYLPERQRVRPPAHPSSVTTPHLRQSTESWRERLLQGTLRSPPPAESVFFFVKFLLNEQLTTMPLFARFRTMKLRTLRSSAPIHPLRRLHPKRLPPRKSAHLIPTKPSVRPNIL